MENNMNLIVAVDVNWGIGKDGNLLVKIPEDLRFFKENTLNSNVIMGRKTMESLPLRKPLTNRNNIVLSKSISSAEGFIVVNDLKELFNVLKNQPKEDVFVIGGEEIYKLLLPMCTKAFITKIDAEFDADRFMVNLDSDPQWELSSIKYSSNGEYNFSFCIYDRVKTQK